MMGPPWSLLIAALVGGALVTAQLKRDCGHASPNGQTLIFNGRNATVSESPWHVGLYVFEKPNNWTMVCGGTLVHPRVVVTAAHCMYGKSLSYGKDVLDAKYLKVSIGSSLQDWFQTSGGNVQHLNVSRLVPHPRYLGRNRLYAADIGLLILEQPVRFSAYVEPACMDWSGNDRPALTEGSVGKVVGWGARTTESLRGDTSPVLLAAELPVISFDKCSKTVRKDLLPYLTDDKFCAGHHVNGSSVAPGDSGGGLTFERDGLWFLMGVVSVGAPHEVTYSTFTNVTIYSDWIRNLVIDVERGDGSLLAAENEGSKCVAVDSGQWGKCSPLADCPSALEQVRSEGDGQRLEFCDFSSTKTMVCCISPNDTTSSFLLSQRNRIDDTIAKRKCREYSQFVFTNDGGKTEDQCMQSNESVVGDWSAQPKEFPHVAHLGFDGDESKDIVWRCGGTLISPSFVMTTASCLRVISYTQLRWVRLGTIHSNISDSNDRPQVIAVAEIFHHPDYKTTLHYNDIGLVRLEKPAEINGYVRPACLYTEPSLPAVPAPVLTGWGAFEAGQHKLNNLKKLAIPFADQAMCNETYWEEGSRDLPLGIVESQFCAGGKGRDACTGDGGSPLQVPTRSLEPYCMHQVVGFPSFSLGCGRGSPGVYTRVSYFVPWIEKIVWPQVGLVAQQKCQEYSRLVLDANGKDKCAVYTISLPGDWEAQPNEYPHMASLGYRRPGSSESEWSGGGSLISPNFVLTAASVLTLPTGGVVHQVRLGSLRPGRSGQVVRVTERLPHPDYRPPAAYSDIALLRLRKPARLSESVRPACLHTAPSIAAKEVPVATGWGAFAVDPSGSPPEKLKKVGLPEVAAEACGRGYPAGDKLLPRGVQAESQLCAGGKGRDVCAGDTGGPLQLVTRNGSASAEPYCMHKIVGVTSARPTCGTEHAGLFARVYHFLPWIESVVWPDLVATKGIKLPLQQQQSEIN